MRRRERLVALALLLLLLPPIVPIATAKEMHFDQVDTGAAAGEPPYGVNFASMITDKATSAGLTEFVVQCRGPCSAASGGPKLEISFREPREYVYRVYDSTSHLTFTPAGSPIPWYNYTYALFLPRAQEPQFRVRLHEVGNQEFVSDWEPLPGIGGGAARFGDAGTTMAYRGDAPRVKSTEPSFFGNPSLFVPDPDLWDQRAIPNGAPQAFTWDLAHNGKFSFPVTRPEDTAAIHLAPVLRTLTRGACMNYTVTVDDRAGQAAESEAHREGVLNAFVDTAANPALATPPVTYAVERVCVQNDVPRFVASFLPDPGNATNGVFTLGSVLDQDHARGFDRLVFTLWDHKSRLSPGARVLGSWDWDSIATDRWIRVPLQALVDGAELCLMDRERNALVEGQAVQDVANLPEPVCSAFDKSPDMALPRAPVTRLIIEAGIQDRTWMSSNGALRDTHRTLAFDPANPEGVLPTLTSILQGVLNEGIRPETTTLVAITVPNLPADDALNALVAKLTMQGVLLVAPAGLPSDLSWVTPKWENHGLAAHPEVLTVGAASSDGTRTRTDSAHGPSPLLRQKPDVTVRTSDSLAGAAAQAEAVLYATDLATWHGLRGITEPRLVKALVMAQAQPMHGNGTLGTASSTGVGALDPARFSADPTRLNRSNLPFADLDATVRDASGAVVHPFPVTTPNALLDIGTVNRKIVKEGKIALENHNGLLNWTLDTHTASLAALLPADADPYNPARTAPLVTVNVTFYNLIDLMMQNLTDAMVAQELRDRLADLDASSVPPGAPDPFNVTDQDREAILGAAEQANAPRGWHFIPETTVSVPTSSYDPSCRAPSLATLRFHGQLAVAFLANAGASVPQAALQSGFQRIDAIAWNDCRTALAALRAEVDAILATLDTRIASVGEPYLVQIRSALAADLDDIDRTARKSIGRSTVSALTWLPLATDAARTSQAPPGFYVGVVQVTTHAQCSMDLQGGVGACRDGTEYAMASLMLVDDASFVLRDRAGRPMPGRAVTLELLLTPVNCAGIVDDWKVVLPLGDLFLLQSSFGTATDAHGVARFPWVTPGYYDVHDGFAGFPIEGTWGGAEGLKYEFEGFREEDCHKPVPVHAAGLVELTKMLDLVELVRCVKTATRGLPVVAMLPMLDAHANGSLAPQCILPGLTASAVEGARGIRRDLVEAALGAEAWQIVYPQVQQARLVDEVLGGDVDTLDLRPPASALDRWSFSHNDREVVAEGSPLTTGAAAFSYTYDLPPNEELAMKWKFSAHLQNTAGVAIFTVREDLERILATLAMRNPRTSDTVLADLTSLLTQTSTHRTSSCTPLAHYRIIPLSPLQGTVDLHAGPIPNAEVQLLGTKTTVSRYFRFHTRECPATTATVAFLFFPALEASQDANLPPTVRLAVSDHAIWTWSAVGTPAVGCPGNWCLVKLPNEEAMAQPWGMTTLDASYARVGIPFDPKIEGWDSFVDLMGHTQALGGTPQEAEIPSLLLHPNKENPNYMGEAPGAHEVVTQWLAEAQRGSRLWLGGVPLEERHSAYLAQAGLTMPNRRVGGASPMDDYATFEWQPEATSRNAPPQNAFDATPNRANGWVAATPTSEGRFGGAYRFTGADSAITVPQSGRVMDEGTLMMWVNPASRADNLGRLFFHQHPGRTVQLVLGLSPEGRVYFQTGSDGSHAMHSNATLPLDQWSHVAVTWQPGLMRIFVDGEESGSIPRSRGVQADYTVTMIGNSPHDIATGGFLGGIDDVREFNVVLDPATIASLRDFPYRAGSGHPSADSADPPRLLGSERFAYPFDGPLQPSRGYIKQTSASKQAGFFAGDETTRTLTFEDLLSDLQVSLVTLAQRRPSPAWVNQPTYNFTAPTEQYSKMLHIPRSLAAAHPGDWIVHEIHPTTGPLLPQRLPPETPYPTPLLAWQPGTNQERYAYHFASDAHDTPLPIPGRVVSPLRG